MSKYEPDVAAAVIGLAAFELWKVWNDSAPSLKECRASEGNSDIRQQVFDADITVGTLAVIIGVSFAVVTKDFTALILLCVMFGTLSFFHHYLINSKPV